MKLKPIHYILSGLVLFTIDLATYDFKYVVSAITPLGWFVYALSLGLIVYGIYKGATE